MIYIIGLLGDGQFLVTSVWRTVFDDEAKRQTKWRTMYMYWKSMRDVQFSIFYLLNNNLEAV